MKLRLKFSIFIQFQAAVGKDIEKQTQAETSSVHRIRIVLTACNVRSLEKVCADLISGAKKQKLRVKVSSMKLKVFSHTAFTWGALDKHNLFALVMWMPQQIRLAVCLNYDRFWFL